MASAPVPVPIYLCGSKPGVIDPTQPARLLRYPDSTLLFASFSPLTPSGTPLPADAPSRARRIVVEVPRANDFFSERTNLFSFVPNAVLAPGVMSEGKWPRVVDYCGRRVVCDQDQWDIHKLDPAYDCSFNGMLPTITRKLRAQSPGHEIQFPADDQPTRLQAVPVREATSATSSILPASASSGSFAAASSSSVLSSPTTSYKTLAPARENVVDAATSPDAASGALYACSFSIPSPQDALVPLPRSASSAASSMERSGQNLRNSPEIDDGGDDDARSTGPPTGSPDSYLGKRKTLHPTGTDASDSSTFLSDAWRTHKRPREVSPAAPKAHFQRKKAQRKRDRERQVEGLDELTRRRRNNQFWVAQSSASVVEDHVASDHPGGPVNQSILEHSTEPTSASAASPDPSLASGLSGQSTPQSTPGPEMNAIPGDDDDDDDNDHDDDDDDGALCIVFIVEKGPKPAEAEEQRRVHQGTHQQATTQDVAGAESHRRQAATDTRAPAQAVPSPLEPVRRQPRQTQLDQWMPWTPRRAIQRYLAISQQFDSARFSPENPVDPLLVPWPVLHSPFTHQMLRVDWRMVEAFFKEASLLMCPKHYRAFVAASRVRFHPDRWRSRGVFATGDSGLSQALERASMAISQAIGPIWDTVRFT